jgi:hypothetical protein
VSGVYTTFPGSIAAVPFGGSLTETRVSGSLFGSESFARTSTVTARLRAVNATSCPAIRGLVRRRRHQDEPRTQIGVARRGRLIEKST